MDLYDYIFLNPLHRLYTKKSCEIIQSYKKKRAKRKKRNPFLLVCSLYWVFDVNLNANAAVRIDKNLSEKHQYTAVNLTFFTLLRPKMHNMQVAWLCFGKILCGFFVMF